MKKKWTKPSLKILIHNQDQENLILGECWASGQSATSSAIDCEVLGCGASCDLP